MSAKLMGAAYTLELPRNERDVLMAMADHADDDGGSVFPSVAYVAWKTDLSSRSVQRMQRSLERKRILVVESAQCGRGRTKRWRIDLSAGTRKSSFQGASEHVDNSRERLDCRKERVTELCHPSELKGDRVLSPLPEERVTAGTLKGDRAVSPEPSVRDNNNQARAREDVENSDRLPLAHPPDPDPMAEMQAAAAEAATKLPDGPARWQLETQAAGILSGLDANVWRTPNGTTVPPSKRPRLWKLALIEYPGSGNRHLRSSVRYVLTHQINPNPLPTSHAEPPGTEAAAVAARGAAAEYPGNGRSSSGPDRGLCPVGAADGPDPEESAARQAEEDRRIAAWQRRYRQLADRLKRQVLDEVRRDLPGIPLNGHVATAAARSRFRQRVLKRIGSNPPVSGSRRNGRAAGVPA